MNPEELPDSPDWQRWRDALVAAIEGLDRALANLGAKCADEAEEWLRNRA